MSIRPFLIALRCGILVLLAAWLLYTLATRVLGTRPSSARDPAAAPQGVRVLLRNRKGDDDNPAWSLLNLAVRQRALVYCPDSPEAYRQVLPAGCNIVVQADQQTGMLITVDGQPVPLEWSVQRIRLIPTAVPAELREDPRGTNRDDLEAEDGRAVFAINGREYRGALDVVRSSWKRMHAINTLPCEAYLDGVMQTEADAAWPPAALESFAIVCRSITVVRLAREPTRIGEAVFHLDDREPAYRGTGRGGDRIRDALVATRGQVLTYLGRPFEPRYHQSSGGFLAAIEEVFPNARTIDGTQSLVDVMPADRDPACHPGATALDPDAYWEHVETLDADDLWKATERKLGRKGWTTEITCWGETFDVDGDGTDDLRRVSRVRLGYYQDSFDLSGEEFRQLVGPDRVPSTLWTIASPEKVGMVDDKLTWRITSYGRGHGVGLSLVSACHLAMVNATAPRQRTVELILGRFYKQAAISYLP